VRALAVLAALSIPFVVIEGVVALPLEASGRGVYPKVETRLTHPIENIPEFKIASQVNVEFPSLNLIQQALLAFGSISADFGDVSAMVDYLAGWSDREIFGGLGRAFKKSQIGANDVDESWSLAEVFNAEVAIYSVASFGGVNVNDEAL
jgi:hypothetical protein